MPLHLFIFVIGRHDENFVSHHFTRFALHHIGVSTFPLFASLQYCRQRKVRWKGSIRSIHLILYRDCCQFLLTLVLDGDFEGDLLARRRHRVRESGLLDFKPDDLGIERAHCRGVQRGPEMDGDAEAVELVAPVVDDGRRVGPVHTEAREAELPAEVVGRLGPRDVTVQALLVEVPRVALRPVAPVDMVGGDAGHGRLHRHAEPADRHPACPAHPDARGYGGHPGRGEARRRHR